MSTKKNCPSCKGKMECKNGGNRDNRVTTYICGCGFTDKKRVLTEKGYQDAKGYTKRKCSCGKVMKKIQDTSFTKSFVSKLVYKCLDCKKIATFYDVPEAVFQNLVKGALGEK